MTLLLKEAEAAGRNLEWRLARGNTAIRALKWLTQDDLLEHAQLRLASQWGSSVAGVGNKDALDYLNHELEAVIGSILEKAIRRAQQDMDSALGNQKEQGDGPSA
ncbi:hypothetical protein [Sphingobium sp. RAC03]|uniref:hypothetical protein n=1 Tax=Sphingobium sp. RAC03 TaxID=1843368 RepID=UPI00083DF762|nr:hypothetical protein [Sphingobium sp. RAC03]AOF95729.1 hypothetical protein BSY17_2684 [Sphingobium sp. RAC03]